MKRAGIIFAVAGVALTAPVQADWLSWSDTVPGAMYQHGGLGTTVRAFRAGHMAKCIVMTMAGAGTGLRRARRSARSAR